MNRISLPEHLRIAIIDDEPIACREIRRGLASDLYDIQTFGTGEAALEEMAQDPFDLVLCDLRLPSMSGFDVLKSIRAGHPGTEVIVITGYGSVDTAIEAIQAGAFHFVSKPVKMGELKSLVSRALEKIKLSREKEILKRSLFYHSRQQYLIGHSPAIQEVLALVKKVCSLNCNVLIHGESGTGKELVARALHFLGSRKESPFMAFNCGGFSEDLIANELFGHEKGAYTGAVETKIGLLESANKGTLFLDEIGIMPMSMQIKLLRFLQERTLIRVGGTKQIPLDVRIIAAGNQDLKKAVEKNQLREDLFYRLNVVQITLPPLRDRKEDISLLIHHFLKKYNLQFGKSVTRIDPEVEEILSQYPFPGNVRELENIVERAVALTDRDVMTIRDLPGDLLSLSIGSLKQEQWPSLEEHIKNYIRKVLIKTNYNRGETARILNMTRTTLWRKLKELSLEKNLK
jgi:DNA-binding NtrC family response regulator